MAPRALKDKQILACKQLYLTNPEGANLSRFLLGKVVSLPRSGRTSYLIEWDRASLNSILPQTSHHLIQTCIGNNDSNRRLFGVARDRYLASSSRSPEQNTTRQQVSQDVQRQLLLQRIMTSPISRRSTTGIVYDSSDSSSSEEEIDGEENEDVVHARFDSSYDVDGTENLTERDRSNVLLDSLLWDFKEYSHTDENLRLVTHQRNVYTEKTVLKTDPNYVSISVPVARHAACAMVADGSHVPQSNNKNRERRRCVVCQLEVNICEEVNESGLRNAAVGKCGSPGCIIAAHTTVQTIGHRKIGTFPQFFGLTCFQIAHHPTTVGLWKQTTCGYTTCQSHPIIKRLKEMHDKTPTIRRVRRRFDEIIGEDLSNIEAV